MPNLHPMGWNAIAQQQQGVHRISFQRAAAAAERYPIHHCASLSFRSNICNPAPTDRRPAVHQTGNFKAVRLFVFYRNISSPGGMRCRFRIDFQNRGWRPRNRLGKAAFYNDARRVEKKQSRRDISQLILFFIICSSRELSFEPVCSARVDFSIPLFFQKHAHIHTR